MMNKKKSNQEFYKQPLFWGIIAVGVFFSIFIYNNSHSTSTLEFDSETEIHVFTREAGSGTREAFTEVAGIVNEAGDDAITPASAVQNSTNATMQAVASDPHAISYISLGSLNSTVKAVEVENIEPTPENIQDGNYVLTRNFSITYGRELSEVAQDFWNFMFSKQAQDIVVEDGYVSIDPDASEYVPTNLSGSVSIVGSTSVEPTIQRFSEAYTALNPDVTIDITAPGSGAGITSAIDGSADIGMVSRDPSEDEAAQLMETEAIAIDGIVIIVNNKNPLEDISLSQLQGIYQEYYTHWNEVLDSEQ